MTAFEVYTGGHHDSFLVVAETMEEVAKEWSWAKSITKIEKDVFIIKAKEKEPIPNLQSPKP